MALNILPAIDTFVAAGASVGLPIPPGALFHADFTLGNYYTSTEAVALASVIGGDVVPATITSEGMPINYGFNGGVNFPDAIGVFASLIASGLTSGITVVVELGNTTGLDGPLFRIYDFMGVWDEGYIIVDVSRVGGKTNMGMNAQWEDDDNYLGVVLSDTNDDSTPGGVLRFAFTLARYIGVENYEYAISVAGKTAKLAYDFSHMGFIVPDVNQIGHAGSPNGWVLLGHRLRKITLFPAKDPADLPALTA